MKSHLLCLFLSVIPLAAQVQYYKLSSYENSNLQSTCGLEAYHHAKVLNGEAEPDGFPWAASVNVRGVLTASFISPRHVLLFNVFEYDKETTRLSLFNDTELSEKGECDQNDWILPKEANEWFQIQFVRKELKPGYPTTINRIVVLGGCIAIDTYKPMIIELVHDMIFDKNHGAVCIPRATDEALFEDDQKFIVYGMAPKGDSLSSAQFKKTRCDEDHEQNFVFCGQPVNESKGLCAGDFGGGAICRSEGRKILLGVYAEGNIRCDAPTAYHQDPEFIDISEYSEDICRQTGICSDQIEESTTMENVLIPNYDTDKPAYPLEPEITTSSATLSSTVETVVAETFERMQLNNCTFRASKEIHIHIHLNEDTKISH